MDTDPIAEIKARLDIVELVSQYVTLKKAGINHLGLCPFHEERTPSFSVSSERQSFKCFGCGRGGDVFSFVMEKEGVDFPTALRLLADKTGVVLPDRPNAPGHNHVAADERTRLFNLNQAAATFWHRILLEHPKAATARDYIYQQRGISKELVEAFMIGVAPSMPATTANLKQHGFALDEQKKAGDPARFAGRLTFPITDITGRVVGFTGRILPSKEDGLRPPTGPKYWNTPETPIFKKSEILYGLHLAKDSIRRTGVAILAEGQMDVIGLHMAKLPNAVASSGTALTERHISIIKRFANELVFAYDADSAGKNAAVRGFDLALAADLAVSVLPLPSGEDPGSLGVKDPDKLNKLFENRQPIIRWLLNNAINANSIGTPAGKKAISKTVLPWIAKVPDAVEQRAWLDVLAEEIKIAPTALETELAKLKRQPNGALKKEVSAKLSPNSPLTLAIGIIGLHPTLAVPYRQLLPTLIKHDPVEPAITAILAPADTRAAIDRSAELALNGAIMTAQQEYSQSTLPELTSELITLMKRAVSDHNKTVTATLSKEIAEADAAGDKERVNTLMQRLQSDTLNPLQE